MEYFIYVWKREEVSSFKRTKIRNLHSILPKLFLVWQA